MKKALTGVVVVGAFLAGAGTALAAPWRDLPKLQTPGVALENGHYRFNSAERNHGSFEWDGDLRDTLPADGNNGYAEVRVEGHTWVRYDGKDRAKVHLHHSNWDGAQRYTDDADMRVCLDRSFHPDSCTGVVHFHAGQR
ncbi:hypothetical protein [Streptomyces sp. NPDC048282]|uniref:hypothetical protein n=1 Tax=Streptomyces sp. NPDC048282 TaxID=3365528 RepID=UPI00371B5CCF